MGKKQYMLIFEPKYAYTQYAVGFKKNGEVVIQEIIKYTDTPKGDTKRKLVKNTLSDIDKILLPLKDKSEFFGKYIDPSIFKYSPYSLHKMFIGYKYQGRFYTLDCVFDDSKLLSCLDDVFDDMIGNSDDKKQMISMISSGSRNFLSFINKERIEGRTKLSDTFINLANSLRTVYTAHMLEPNELSLVYEQMDLEDKMLDKLDHYKEYREVFLLKERYLQQLKLEKERLREARKTITETPKPFIGEQTSFLNEDGTIRSQFTKKKEL